MIKYFYRIRVIPMICLVNICTDVNSPILNFVMPVTNNLKYSSSMMQTLRFLAKIVLLVLILDMKSGVYRKNIMEILNFTKIASLEIPTFLILTTLLSQFWNVIIRLKKVYFKNYPNMMFLPIHSISRLLKFQIFM